MPRKLDFDSDEGGEEELIFKRSLKLKVCSKMPRDDTIQSVEVASQDLFNSPDPEAFNKTLEIPNTNFDELVHDMKSDSESADDNIYGANSVESNHVVAESSNREEGKEMLVMIPESNSESSSAEFSPLSVDLFSQSQVQILIS